jgi:tetratricopeptide (TPR) repeat protein
MRELDKLHGGAPMPPPVKKTEPVKPPPAKKDDDDDFVPAAGLSESKKAYNDAEQFAKSHSSDDYAVALRWFQMANEHPGTDYAMKALEFARQAQTRFSAKSAPVDEALPDTPEMKFVKDGDIAAKAGKFDEAVAQYLSSIKAKESVIAHRKLGHLYYQRAQELKDKLLPQLEANEDAWRKARKEAYIMVRTLGGQRRKFNPNHPPLVEANKKQIELVKEANISIANYDKAFEEFKAVLRLAPNKKDLDAAGHQALCLTVKGDSNARMRGRQMINQFLSDYTPANDIERSLYEYCKTDLARINKG